MALLVLGQTDKEKITIRVETGVSKIQGSFARSNVRKR